MVNLSQHFAYRPEKPQGPTRETIQPKPYPISKIIDGEKVSTEGTDLIAATQKWNIRHEGWFLYRSKKGTWLFVTHQRGDHTGAADELFVIDEQAALKTYIDLWNQGGVVVPLETAFPEIECIDA